MSLADPMPLPNESDACAVAASAVVAGQELTIFAESPQLILSMVKDIQAAQKRVWMETYIFANDDAGRAVATALAERAAAGVDVRLMVDAFGSFGTPSVVFNRLRAAGVKVHVFHALWDAVLGRLQFLRVLNQRNHRKLLIVDDRVAYFGGMNVVDQTIIHSKADAKNRHLPSSAGWRDVHVRLVGSRQVDVARAFERLWRRAHHEPLRAEPRWPIQQMLNAPNDSIFFFDSRPALRLRRPQRILVPLIQSAQREVTLCVAYFMPMGRILRELFRARKRGVRVQVIIPGQSDVKLVHWATRHYYEFLLNRGIRIYERKDRMLHSKAMVVDGKWSVIGSCNLDNRSLRSNLEFFAVIHSPEVANALRHICLEEIRNSIRVTADFCKRRSRWQRLVDRTAWAFRHWL